jgi:hypothetical protein
MISQKVQRYIEEYTIVRHVEEYNRYAELVFQDWESFLDLLYAEGGRVYAILWWDHCKIADHIKSIGSGGFIDPRNPEYMFAETPLYEQALETKSLDEIKAYIREIKKSDIRFRGYISFDLVPSFYIR